MADPVYYYGRRRSLTGPVILIIIGTLFLLANMRILHAAVLWALFARFWPLLLVLAGLIKLIEHFSDQRAGVPTRRLGGGTVVLIIFLVILGLAATTSYRFRDRV